MLTPYGLLETAVETAVEAFDSEMASGNPHCFCLARIADVLRGRFEDYSRGGGNFSEVD